MLTVHTVRLGGHAYYVDDLVPGRAEGSPLAGERTGVWVGPGATGLGLDGAVGREPFAALPAGRDPRSGEVLGGARHRVSVAAYDLTFAAPKSVSLLAALAPSEVARATVDGHDASVAAVADYLSRRAVGVRRAAGGTVRLLPSTGLVAGSFLHRTSRALDPHLHTHLVVANVARGVDGSWSAVDGRRVFAHVRAAGQLYRSHLRAELTERLGAAWEVSERGMGDVVGVDASLRLLFSQRRSGIEEQLGSRSGRGSRTAAYFADRPDKDRAVTVEVLRPEWRRRAADFGHDLGCLGAVVGRGRGQGAVGRLDVGRLEGALAAMDRPGRSLARRDVVGLVARSTVDGAAVDRVEAMADGLLTSPVSDRAVLPAPERVATVGVEARWSAGGLLAAVREHDRTPGAWSHDARPGPSERGARGRAPDREPAREPGRHRGHDTVRGR